MSKFVCNDGTAEIEIEADTAQEAAQEYVDGGDWGDGTSTIWIDVSCTPLDENGEKVTDEAKWVTITLEPDEPKCSDGKGHDWTSEGEGGLEENPGVFGNGGGVLIYQHCRNCGLRKIIDTWAQRTDTGEQGLRSVEYESEDN